MNQHQKNNRNDMKGSVIRHVFAFFVHFMVWVYSYVVEYCIKPYMAFVKEKGINERVQLAVSGILYEAKAWFYSFWNRRQLFSC